MNILTYFILVISDIHLGHDKNTTEQIVNNLRKFFIQYHTSITKTKLLIIPGDIFDRLLGHNSIDMLLATKWLSELVVYCKDHNIILRILEGTPSHDWGQVTILHTIISNLNIDINFKYIDKVSVEYIEELDTNILYHPDDWKAGNEICEKNILKVLKDSNLTHIDMGVLHGAFKFQLPDFIDELLEPDFFLNIIKGPIFCGHVHFHTVYKRILIPGSFDSLTHSDDNSQKGGLFVEYKTDNTFIYKFLKNTNQLTFLSIDATKLTLLDVKNKLNSIVKNKKQHIRILESKANKLKNNQLELEYEYPNVVFTFKNVDDKKVNTSIDVTKRMTNITKLTRDNIRGYIIKEMDSLPHTEQDIILEEFTKLTIK